MLSVPSSLEVVAAPSVFTVTAVDSSKEDVDVPRQHLYRCGDLDHDIVTHFIHVVISDSEAWNNYINFRDYLNSNPEDAKSYELLKVALCSRYPEDRTSYVDGKKELVTELLAKAKKWREEKEYI